MVTPRAQLFIVFVELITEQLFSLICSLAIYSLNVNVVIV